jgi:hypothetical protein
LFPADERNRFRMADHCPWRYFVANFMGLRKKRGYGFYQTLCVSHLGIFPTPVVIWQPVKRTPYTSKIYTKTLTEIIISDTC